MDLSRESVPGFGTTCKIFTALPSLLPLGPVAFDRNRSCVPHEMVENSRA